jgi:hypothetical protein
MNVEIGKAAAAETPASVIAGDMMEHIAAVMMLVGGIESISAQKYTCGFGSKLHVSIAPFAGVPKDIALQGVAIKDALAQILSVANITKVTAQPSASEMLDIRRTWDASVKSASEANGGSSQF